ncbi:MAG: hypothetical protein ABI587_08930 [Gemmatimonadales bacterium]
MSHLEERTLDKLVGGTATAHDVHRIVRHVEECRACARKLEEWRDNFAEVDERFPELALDMPAMATVTPGGLVLMPDTEAPRHRFNVDLSTILWIGAVLLALLVGYGASRLRQPSEGMVASSGSRDQAAAPSGSASAPQAPAVIPLAAPPPHDTSAATTPPLAAPLPAPTAVAAQPVARPEREAEASPTTPLATSPQFKKVPRAEAVRRLGGPIRSLPGYDTDHLEVGAASAVPGAQPGLEVVRVVYRTPQGGRILLDQQLIPIDSSGFRPIDDPTLESGATAYGTSPTGVSVATWLDEEGYRISLVAQLPLDSLKKLVPLVR